MLQIMTENPIKSVPFFQWHKSIVKA